MDPSSTIVKDHNKASNNDYEALPALNTYDTPGCQVSDASYQNEIATDTSDFRDGIKENIVGEALSDDEQIYEDPGHNKEEIYAWFEEKRFRKIKGNNIRCVEYHIVQIDAGTNYPLINLEEKTLAFLILVHIKSLH